MRIALIWPHACTVYHTLPLSLGLLYSNIRDQGHRVRLFNLPLEGWTASSPEFREAIAAFQPDLVATTAWPMAFPSALAAIQVAREVCPQATYLLGGNYATLNTRQAFDTGAFDYVMAGECERTFAEFVALLQAGDRRSIVDCPGICYRDSETGEVIRRRNTFHTNLDELGAVDYEFIELDRALRSGYMRTLLGPRRKLAMFATRGCEYACNFCTAPIMNGTRLRHYSVEYLTREIRKVYDRYGIRQILFMDDNATQDVEFFKDLCRGIIALDLRDLEMELYRGVRLENLDEEMVRLMKGANFKVVTIAPESGSERVRKLMKKDMASEDIRRAARLVKNAGLWLQAYFIIGYPGETAAERQETYRLIAELDLDIFELHRYCAIPGTGSFLKLVKEGMVRRDYTEESFINGDSSLPDFNGDSAQVDREIFLTYARFYLRKPRRARQLLRLVSLGGLRQSLSGITIAAVRSLLGRPTGPGAEVVWRPS